ncbi:condensin complex subunit 2-like isoform X2 [Ischnura elegans]|uniref:condensin complex subunit 2-like isoform X2 n=1 Tax=Ischnura elegans TaxID=197161 RepID=UPI001ED88181|nr:condensin complex subunit 2-like isoform X2 [Ischnura elegans]
MATQPPKRIESPLRRISVGTPSSTSGGSTPQLLPNDDESVRRQRRLSIMTEMQIMDSPKGSLNPIAHLNAVQLAEHYENCMRLSSKNKITSKNAFQLQLIDHMAMMLKKKEPQMENFQVASCTLDAVTKIYACRVDNVYHDACKIAAAFTSAGRTKNEDGRDMRTMEEEIGVTVTQPAKRKKTKGKSSILKNLDRITLKETELRKVDPYIRWKTLKSGEGECGGFLLQRLSARTESEEYDITPDASWWRERQPQDRKPLEFVNIPTPNFRAISSAEISPSTSSFTFVGWKPELKNDLPCSSKSENFDACEVWERDPQHAYDMNAVPEQVQLNESDDMDEAATDDLEAEEKIPYGRKKTSWEWLRESLSIEPQEYSYFKKAALVGWSGPNHWKVDSILRKKAGGKVAMKRKAAEKTFLVYDEVNEDDFIVLKRSICLKASSVEKWNDKKNTLPPDLNIYPSALLRSFLKPKISLETKDTSAVNVDGIDPFNFDNTNDRENYCSNEVINEYESESDDNECEIQELSFLPLPDAHELATAESGYELVAAPNKSPGNPEMTRRFTAELPTSGVKYVKQSKALKMKKLSEVIYKLVTPKQDAAANAGDEEEIRGAIKFTEVYKKIPAMLTSREAQNLSIPIAFVALLHAASEKNLRLKGQSDLLDITISHGVNDQSHLIPHSLSLPREK